MSVSLFLALAQGLWFLLAFILSEGKGAFVYTPKKEHAHRRMAKEQKRQQKRKEVRSRLPFPSFSCFCNRRFQLLRATNGCPCPLRNPSLFPVTVTSPTTKKKPATHHSTSLSKLQGLFFWLSLILVSFSP